MVPFFGLYLGNPKKELGFRVRGLGAPFVQETRGRWHRRHCKSSRDFPGASLGFQGSQKGSCEGHRVPFKSRLAE